MPPKYIKYIDQPTPIDIIIPCAGLGRRMKSYGPKSLIVIKKNLRIIDNQLKLLKKNFPTANIILVTGFESDAVMNSTPMDIVKIENENYDTTNVMRSIGIGLRACKRDVLIVYGDLIFNNACLELDFNHSSIMVGESLMKQNEIGCVFNKRMYLENMMYDLPHKWSQIAFFKGVELEMLKKISWDKENYNMFGFEAINKILSQGGKFKCILNKNAKCIDIDSSKDLAYVGEII